MEKLFQGRVDISEVTIYDTDQWRLKGRFVDLSGSFSAFDIALGDWFVIAGITINGVNCFDRYNIIDILGYDANYFDVVVECMEDGGPNNFNVGPLTGSHAIGRSYQNSILFEIPSFYEQFFEPRVETAMVNLNFKKVGENLGGTIGGYTHPAYAAINQNFVGASVLSNITTDTIGSVTNISTRTLTLVDLGYTAPAQYWSYDPSAHILTPVDTGGAIYSSAIIRAGSNTDYAYLYDNGLRIDRKTSSPTICSYRQNSGGLGVKYADSLMWINGSGFYNTTSARLGFDIYVEASQDWSATQSGTSLNLRTVRNGTVSLVSRIYITGDGNIVFNENGEATNFRVEGDTDQNLFLVDGVNDRVGIGTSGSVATKLHVRDSASWGLELVKLEQLDQDKAFIDFAGTEASDDSTNISTRQGDASGSVSGPRRAVSGIDGWKFYRMVKQEVNGVECWMCTYQKELAL